MRNSITTSGTRAFQKLPVDNQDGKGALRQGQREPRGRSLGGEDRQVVKLQLRVRLLLPGPWGAVSPRAHGAIPLAAAGRAPERRACLFRGLGWVQAGRGHSGPGHRAGLEFSSHHYPLPAVSRAPLRSEQLPGPEQRPSSPGPRHKGFVNTRRQQERRGRLMWTLWGEGGLARVASRRILP